MGKATARAILLIEDNADVVRFMVRLLEPLGAEVVSAADGEAARKASKKTPPDLMIVDLVLPGMSGLDAVRAIKKDDPRLDATPVVVLTGHPSPDNIREAVDLGVVDYLVKPTFLSEAGLDRIRRALEAAPKAPAPRSKP
jgi:two-component system response regulator MtrA